jgi:NAD(P)-dependent dehydrogenase (short-subunit alcohol dehydrogenase family)
VNLTSRMGLLDPPVPPGNVGYAVGKAGLNMLTVTLASELDATATVAAAISPGWVRTGDSGAILGHDGTDLLAHGAERA